MRRVTRDNNFIYFTLAIVALMLISSFGGGFSYEAGRGLTEVLKLLVVGVAFSVLHYGTRWKVIASVTIVLILLLNVFHAWLPVAPREFLRDFITLVFYAIALFYAGRQVLTAGEVTTNTMVGALAVYLLLGLAWAQCYMLLLFFSPDAFNGIAVATREHHFAQVLYFSFITLTTLGYGDITPAMPLARTLVFLEAIAGAFYLAMVVASLVSARSNQHKG